jgi:hypothetical protein
VYVCVCECVLHANIQICRYFQVTSNHKEGELSGQGTSNNKEKEKKLRRGQPEQGLGFRV